MHAFPSPLLHLELCDCMTTDWSQSVEEIISLYSINRIKKRRPGSTVVLLTSRCFHLHLWIHVLSDFDSNVSLKIHIPTANDCHDLNRDWNWMSIFDRQLSNLKNVRWQAEIEWWQCTRLARWNRLRSLSIVVFSADTKARMDFAHEQFSSLKDLGAAAKTR